MAKQRSYGGVYDNMEFETYEFREYPKHVKTGKYGQFAIVHDAEEERALLGELEKKQVSAAALATADAVDHEKERLITQARTLGIAINTKWSKSKLQQVIKTAEEEMDNLPPEGEEEIAVVVVAEETATPSGISEEEYKDQLIVTAKELGLKSANRLWGIPRLKASIAEAEAHLKIEE